MVYPEKNKSSLFSLTPIDPKENPIRVQPGFSQKRLRIAKNVFWDYFETILKKPGFYLISGGRLSGLKMSVWLKFDLRTLKQLVISWTDIYLIVFSSNW